MRERRVLRVDHAAGSVTASVERLAAGSLSQRIAELIASVEPDYSDESEIRLLAVQCNGCGAMTPLDFEAPELPDGWTSTELGEFCPAGKCQQAGKG